MRRASPSTNESIALWRTTLSVTLVWRKSDWKRAVYLRRNTAATTARPDLIVTSWCRRRRTLGPERQSSSDGGDVDQRLHTLASGDDLYAAAVERAVASLPSVRA